MKVRIKKRFRDIDTRKIMFIGEYAEYDKDRAKQLAEGGFVTIEESEKVLSVIDNPSESSDVDNEDTTDDDHKEDIDEKVESEHVPKSEISTSTPRTRKRRS